MTAETTQAAAGGQEAPAPAGPRPKYLDAPKKPTRLPLKTALVFADITALNLLFYYFIKALLFYSIDFAGAAEVAIYGVLFAAAYVALGRLKLWGKRTSWFWLALQIAAIAVVSVKIYTLASYLPFTEDDDWSWLRPEVIKVPLWMAMFVRQSPVFTALFLAGTAAMIHRTLAKPESLTMRLLPLGLLAVLVWLILRSFAGIWPGYMFYYLTMFVGPFTAFAVLSYKRAWRLAFRMIPLSFHMILISTNYAGLLPAQSAADLLPFADVRAGYVERIPGARMLYPPLTAEPDNAFLFLRQLVLDDRNLYISYGPMGASGLISINRENGATDELEFYGLIRDVKPYGDTGYLLAVNWQTAEFEVVHRDGLYNYCSADLRPLGFLTPWNILVVGERIFISNVTYPLVGEFRLELHEEEGCDLTMVSKRNFYEDGYADFTDGAFGMHYDPERNILYAVVGMLEGRYVVGLVALDADTLETISDVRLPAGTTVFPIKGGTRALLPSYYYDEIHEVELPSLEPVRVIAAEPSIFSLAYDEKRDLIYGVSRTSGMLQVLDYASGDSLGLFPVSAKSEPLAFDAAGDRLYVGGKIGVMEIDLGEFAAQFDR